MGILDRHRDEIVSSEGMSKLGLVKQQYESDELAQKMLNDLVPIDISEPVALFFDNPKEYYDYREDFISFLSPFQFAFYEAACPAYTNNQGQIISTRSSAIKRLGWLISTFPLKPGVAVPEKNFMYTMILDMASRNGRKIIQPLNSEAQKGFEDHTPAHIQTTRILVESEWKELKEIGIIFDYLDTGGLPIIGTRSMICFQEEFAQNGSGQGFLLPLNFCISLLHCKNVTLRDRKVDPKLQAKAARKGKPPKVIYKVLELTPFKQEFKQTPGVGGERLIRALHICRGHFANYTEDKPLFGRYVGKYWISAHTRGKREVGAVLKDYKIRTCS